MRNLKSVLLLLVPILGLFFNYPGVPLPSLSGESNAPVSFLNKNAILGTAGECFRSDDKELERDPLRHHKRLSSSTADAIATEWACVQLSFISYCSQSNYNPSDTSFWGSRIEILSARPHPPTAS